MIIYGVFNFFIAYFVVEREKEVARRTGHYFNWFKICPPQKELNNPKMYLGVPWVKNQAQI